MTSRILNILIGTLLVSMAAAHADVVFTETFNNPSAGDASLELVGWHANSGSTGTALSESNTSLANGPVVSSGDFMIYGLTTPANLLTWIETTGIGSISSVTNISVSVRNDQSNADLKIAIKVDNAWFITQDVANSPTVSAWEIGDFSVQDISWNALTFVSGSTLVEGGAISLPSSGTVNAVGVYDTVSSKVRFDTFTVEVIPVVLPIAFHETFENLGTTDAGLASVGWHANSGSVGTALSESNTLLANGPVVSFGDFIIYGLTTPTNLLTWTEATGIGSISSVAKISVSVRNDQSNADLKVAIKVDGAWFVTQEVMNSPTVTAGVTVTSYVQNVSWNALTFASGSTLVEGGSISLPSSGTVNAVGIYDAVSSKVRFDDFTVYSWISNTSLYAAWNAAYNLSGPDAELDADPDSDAMNNLVEYALGGNPTNSDASAVLPFSGLAADGGTNWLEYVYHRRLDAATRGLTYEVVREDDLILGSWTNSGITEAGTVVLDAEFEAVTNRIPTETDVQQFMKLNIGFE